jgi:hypothetical protein
LYHATCSTTDVVGRVGQRAPVLLVQLSLGQALAAARVAQLAGSLLGDS